MVENKPTTLELPTYAIEPQVKYQGTREVTCANGQCKPVPQGYSSSGPGGGNGGGGGLFGTSIGSGGGLFNRSGGGGGLFSNSGGGGGLFGRRR